MADNLFGKLKGSLEQATNSIANLPLSEQTKNVASNLANQSINVLSTSVEQAKEVTAKSVDLTKSLTNQSVETISNVVNKGIDLAKEDLQTNGSWSYKTLQVPLSEVEELENKLNELGKEYWELIQIIGLKQNIMLVLKKPNEGYIANTIRLAKGNI